LALLFLVCCARPAFAQNVPGPLEVPDPHPMTFFRLDARAGSAAVLPEATVRTRLMIQWANTFNKEQNTWGPMENFIDLESWRIEPELRWGIAEWYDVAIRLPFYRRGAGVMDGFIENFHDLVNVGGDREEFPKNTYRFDVQDIGLTLQPNRPLFQVDDGWGWGDVTLHGKAQFMTWPQSMALELSVKLPTGEDEFGGEGVDLGVALHTGALALDTHYHLSVQYTWISDEEMSESAVFFEHNFAAFLDLAWPIGDGWFIHLQPQVFNGFLHQPPRMSDTRMYILGGLTGTWDSGWEVEFALVENVFSFENTVDFGLHMAVSRIF
jgi:hypothetical protein